MVLLISHKTQMMDTDATKEKDCGSVSTHYLSDEKVEETTTKSSRSGRLYQTEYERSKREKLAFFPLQVPSNESSGIQICQEPEYNLVEEESEGEAPEATTAAAGLHQSRSLASKAGKAIGRYSFFDALSILFLINLDKK